MCKRRNVKREYKSVGPVGCNKGLGRFGKIIMVHYTLLSGV